MAMPPRNYIYGQDYSNSNDYESGSGLIMVNQVVFGSDERSNINKEGWVIYMF
jgi:hypothetical protein